MESTPSYVGIDVAKAHLDVAMDPMGEVWRVEHHVEGIARVTEQLAALSPTLVVLEATGGLELPLVGGRTPLRPAASGGGQPQAGKGLCQGPG